MALLQFVATINSGMLLYNKDFIFIEGSEFKHASECLPAEKDKVSRASSFTFTPTKNCSDYITGDLKENLFKVIRPTGADQHSYVSANHTCCIKYLDGKKTVPYKHSTNSVVFVLFNMLLATILVLVDGAKALYYECGVKEKVSERLEDVVAGTAKNKVMPANAPEVVANKANDVIDDKAAKSVNTFLGAGKTFIGFVIYVGAVFPLNQIVGNILGVDKTEEGIVFKGDMVPKQEGSHYGVWSPANEKFQKGLFETIMGGFISAFFAAPGVVVFVFLFFYIVLRAVNMIEPCGWCGKDDAKDKKKSRKYACTLFVILFLICIPIIIMYFTMYFSGFPDLPSFVFGMGLNFPPKFPHLGSIMIGITIMFATLIRFSISCFKTCKSLRTCKLGCGLGRLGLPKCAGFNVPVLGDLWTYQFGTVIISYPKFKFGLNLCCSIPFVFWNMYWFAACCGAQICQCSCCGTPTFKPRAGKWVINEETWQEEKETNEYIEQLRGSIAAIKDGAATAKDVRKIKKQFGPDSPEYADVIKKAGTKVVNAVKS